MRRFWQLQRGVQRAKGRWDQDCLRQPLYYHGRLRLQSMRSPCRPRECAGALWWMVRLAQRMLTAAAAGARVSHQPAGQGTSKKDDGYRLECNDPTKVTSGGCDYNQCKASEGRCGVCGRKVPAGTACSQEGDGAFYDYSECSSRAGICGVCGSRAGEGAKCSVAVAFLKVAFPSTARAPASKRPQVLAQAWWT